MALKIKVTTAGRAALVNAENTGTLPVLIAQVGVTATAFTPAADGSDLALPGELKRLVTFGGAAVADDTIHSVIRDTSTDTYTWRGFGMYLTDGTLFGLYGQPDPILEKSAGAAALLATDIIFADIDAAALTFGDTNFLNPPATTEVQGVVELATDAEALAGVDAVRAVTPKGLLAKLTALLGAGAPSAFVKSLLTAVDLVAFRTLLSIKTAASYDIGVGNGLDADLLDGQHGAYYRSYANLTDVPGTFTPSPHGHDAGDITGGVLGVLRGGTGVATFAAGSYLVGNGTGAIVVKTPAQVLGDIGAAAVVHSHAIAEVNGLDAALAARPLQTSVTAQISAAVNALIDGAPGAIDTLNELAAAMGDDPNFAATVTNALATKASLTANNNFTGANRFNGDSGLSVDGPTGSRLTLYAAGVRRGLLSVSAATGIGTFVVYAADGGTSIGQFDIGTGGMKYSGGFTLNCLAGADVLTVNNPGSTPAGSFVTIGGPASSPGIVAQYGTTKRRDIQFTNTGVQIAVSSTTGNTGVQYTFGEAGNLSMTGALSCLTFNATGSDIRLKDDVKVFAPRPLHRLLASLPGTHGPIVSYTHRVDHAFRIGPIAQDMERIEPAYMGTIEIEEGQVEGIAAGTYKTVDKASAAYEQAMWAGQEIDRLLARIEALEAR